MCGPPCRWERSNRQEHRNTCNTSAIPTPQTTWRVRFVTSMVSTASGTSCRQRHRRKCMSALCAAIDSFSTKQAVGSHPRRALAPVLTNVAERKAKCILLAGARQSSCVDGRCCSEKGPEVFAHTGPKTCFYRMVCRFFCFCCLYCCFCNFAFSVLSAASASFVLHFLLFVLLLLLFVLLLLLILLFVLLLGLPPLENPPLPLVTFQNVKNNFTIDKTPLTWEKVKNKFLYPEKNLWSQKSPLVFCIPKKTFVHPKKHIPSATNWR